jgi:hypothetical protein
VAVAEAVHFVALEFSTGTLYLSTGAVDVTWNAHTWVAVGGALELGAVQETGDTSAQALDLTLAGVDQTVVVALFGAGYRGRAVTVYRAYLDAATGTVVGTPLTLFAGIQRGAYTVEESRTHAGGAVTVRTTVQTVLATQRVRGIQANLVSHAQVYTGDTFFQNVAALQNIEVYWGTSDPRATASGGRAGGNRRGPIWQ